MNSKRFRLVFFLSVLFLGSWYLDRSTGWNTVSRVGPALNLVLEGSWELGPYAEFTGDHAQVNGVNYSDKAPLPALLLVPVLWVAALFSDPASLTVTEQLRFGLGLGAFFLSALPFAWINLAIFRRLERQRGAVWWTLLATFGSFLLALSGTFFAEPLTALFFLLAIHCILAHKYGRAGLATGAAFLCSYGMGLAGLLVGLLLLIRREWKGFALFSLGTAPFLLLQAGYNQLFTGNWTTFLYAFQENFRANREAFGFTGLNPVAAFHLLISPYRGLFFYAPLLIMVLREAVLRRQKEVVTWFGMTLIFVVLFSANWNWYGGWTYGPRHLYAWAAALFYIGLPEVDFSLRHNRVAAWSLGGFGLMGALLNMVTVRLPPTEVGFPLADLIFPEALAGRWNPYFLADTWLSSGVSAAVFVLLFSGMAVVLSLLHRRLVLAG